MNILIVVLYVVYIGIKKRLSFTQQRSVLIGLPIIAVATILLKSRIDVSSLSYSLQVIELNPVQLGEIPTGLILESTPIFSLIQIYWMGAIAFGLLFLFRIAKIIAFFQKNESKKVGQHHLYKVNGRPSFSFLNHIQITPSLSTEEQVIVLEHEKIHVRKKHSFDTMFIELIHILFWFNPIFLFIKREMVNLHEYEVDALMYKKHKVNYMKFLVNFALGLNGSHYLLTSRFYNRLTLKKRINIMKTKNRKYPILLMIVPIIMMAFTFVSWTTLTNESEIELPTEAIELVEESVQGIAKEPTFPGGSEAMSKFIGENVVYPPESKEKKEEGTVYVGFIVEADGTITHSNIRGSSKHTLLDEEALRVINLMPNWIAGERDGKKVKVEFTLPIQFKLSE